MANHEDSSEPLAEMIGYLQQFVPAIEACDAADSTETLIQRRHDWERLRGQFWGKFKTVMGAESGLFTTAAPVLSHRLARQEDRALLETGLAVIINLAQCPGYALSPVSLLSNGRDSRSSEIRQQEETRRQEQYDRRSEGLLYARAVLTRLQQLAAMWNGNSSNQPVGAIVAKRPPANDIQKFHDAVVECLDALAQISGRTVKPDESESEVFGRLEAAVSKMAALGEDPFGGTHVVEMWGMHATTWHGLVLARAREWAERLPRSLSDSKSRRAQCHIMPSLQHVELSKIRAELEVELRRAQDAARKEGASKDCVLHDFLWQPAADQVKTKDFVGVSHDDMLRRLRQTLDTKFVERPRATIIQCLRDEGCDLLIDWGNGDKFGIQLKSHFDISEKDFEKNTLAQIQRSRAHGLKRLFVLLAGDLTDSSQEQKVRGFEAVVSRQNDEYVVTISPERLWTLNQ